MTKEQFAHKIDNEGGVWEALAYGVPVKDVPTKRGKELWEKLDRLYKQAHPIIEELGKLGLLL